MRPSTTLKTKNGANNNATKSIVPGTRVAVTSSRKWSSANSSVSRWEAVQEAASTGVNRVFTKPDDVIRMLAVEVAMVASYLGPVCKKPFSRCLHHERPSNLHTKCRWPSSARAC